jgi:hypothetical protein
VTYEQVAALKTKTDAFAAAHPDCTWEFNVFERGAHMIEVTGRGTSVTFGVRCAIMSGHFWWSPDASRWVELQ